jgi:acyl-CoA synthetase (AMP-forming)/AMP-acid ligase II
LIWLATSLWRAEQDSMVTDAVEAQSGRGIGGVPRDGHACVDRVAEHELSNESIGDVLDRLSKDAGDCPAIIWAAQHAPGRVTWSELCDGALRGAATLLDINPRRGRVALAALNSVDWIVAMFAGAVAGMPIVPVSASATKDELRYQLENADVAVVLAARSAGEHQVLASMTALADCLDNPPVVRDIATICADERTAVSPVSADAEFLVQYTSGTTGRPKAASLSHRAAVDCGLVFSRVWGGGGADRFLNPLPLHHVGGSVTGLIAALAMGGTYVLVERFSPQLILDTLRQTEPTIAGLVPTMMIDMLAMPGVSPADFASLRTVIGGASAIDPALIAQMEQQLGVTMIGSYGQSEAPAMTASSPSDPAHVRTQTLGRCLPGRALAIRDSEGVVAATGEVGELCVRGPLSMTGYLQPDGSIDTATDADGWRRTGDLCSMDDDGVITFHGRIREVIIRGGLNIYPAEVEQALSTHESVAEIAVFGAADSRLGESVVAAVIPAADATVALAELNALAGERLSSYKRPVDWVVVSTLPRTSTGKVRKHQLREWYESGILNDMCGAATS